MRTVLVLIAFLLAGCGGGGDGGGATPTASFTIQIAGLTGGSVSPSSVTVNQGQTATFTLTPDTGFSLVSVSGCGGTLSGNIYQTGPITSNCSITASFQRKSYSVTAVSQPGGSFNPVAATVLHGDTTFFDLTVAPGFQLLEVTGCGGRLEGNRFTTAAITADCIVSAHLNELSFDIDASSGAGGSISPSTYAAKFNERASFQVMPDLGFKVSSISGCGGELQGLVYVTAPVTASCSINAAFDTAEYAITAVSAGGGSISPSRIEVKAGGSASFTVTADPGFRFQRIENCDGRLDGNLFIVENVTASCEIVAFFNQEERVEFADPQLAALIRTQLDLSANAPIPADRLALLSRLEANAKGISRLDGLQYATGLTYLDLSANSIRNFSVLNALAGAGETAALETLYLANNPVEILPDFSKFSGLVNLSLESTELSLLPDLSMLANLRYLNIAFNNISDLSSLTGLALHTLYVNENKLADTAFSVLAGMPLRTLHVDRTDFSSISNVSTLTQLEDFSANYTQLTEINGLSGLPNLSRLSIFGSQVIDVSPALNLFPNNRGAFFAGGCFKTSGFARSSSVLQALTARGVFVRFYDWAIPYDGGCIAQDIIRDLRASASMNNEGLLLNWSLQSDDTGPWRCELHLELNAQQPRVPAAVLDNCHLANNWLVPEFNRNRVQPHLIIDNGSVRQVARADIGEVVHVNGTADPYIHSSDWLQIVAKTAPYLVPYRDAKLRLHVLSTTGKAPPVLRAWLREGSNQTALSVTAPATLPASKQLGSLSSSYLVDVPSARAKPGITIALQLADQPEVLITPQFAAVNSIDLTLVPFAIDQKVTTLPSTELVRESILTVWPLASVNITNRAPFQLATAPASNTTFTMLDELFDLRIAERGSSFYYGYFLNDMNNDRWAGLAYKPGFTGVGVVPSGNVDTVISHELGHNFNLQHAPCGNAEGVDRNFPYAGASIGTFGVTRSFNRLLDPLVFKDLMSYCSNEHISDYNLELAQDYLVDIKNDNAVHLRTSAAFHQTENAVAGFAQPQPTEPSFFYRLILDTDLSISVEQAMQLDYMPELKGNRAYHVLASFEFGPPLLLPVEILEVGHGSAKPQLTFAVPASLQGAKLSGWELYQGQRNVLAHTFVSTVTQGENMSVQRQATQSAKMIEQAGQVCVEVSTQFDSMNLMLNLPERTLAIALNETSSSFCRDSSQLPTGGRWQLQLRRGLVVEPIYQLR